MAHITSKPKHCTPRQVVQNAVERGAKMESQGEQTRSSNLIVGTILPDCEPVSQQWLDLQLRFLKATTKHFHHVSVVQKGEITPFFNDNTEVIKIDGQPLANSAAHVRGLERLKTHFSNVQNDFRHFLFIDMDAFPVRRNWLEILLAQMKTEHEIAIPVRFENLEQRLHSSILFCKREALSNLRWSVKCVGNDLIGSREMDVTLEEYQVDRRRNVFTLIRSNAYQIHPLLCGMYYDLFYHNGCGSGRVYNMRSRPYWKHVVPQNVDVKDLIEQLFANPDNFIRSLGWKESDYGKV